MEEKLYTIRRLHLYKGFQPDKNIEEYITYKKNNGTEGKRTNPHVDQIRIRESELIRILLTIDKCHVVTADKYPLVDGLISVKIKPCVKIYANGLTLFLFNGNKYVRLMTGAGSVRSGKCLYIKENLFDKVNKILLCGHAEDMALPNSKICKYNAYCGLASSDSLSVSFPNIVVIDDYCNPIMEQFDVVYHNGKDRFQLQSDMPIKWEKHQPFDGAGVITIQKAAQWAKELGLGHVPAAFQFRCLPYLKGNLYVFDIIKFAKTFNARKITDVWGKVWDLFDDKIDCIMTKSQFKFDDKYNNMEEWQTNYLTALYGYHRTFNISGYSCSPDSISKEHTLNYQYIQTLDNMGEDSIHSLCNKTISKIESISSDLNAFLRYRHIDNKAPSYYKALSIDPALSGDAYIQHKIIEDISGIKRRAKIGKVLVSGNYQTLAPDIFALAQYAFGIEVTGLVPAYCIYSQYWLNQCAEEVDVLRSPHVAREHAVRRVCTSPEIDNWFEYQTTGIMISIYDSIAQRLNSADHDGDEVFSSDDKVLVSEALQRPCNTILEMREKDTKTDPEYHINQTQKLIDIDVLGMKGNIGKIIDKITMLWSLPLDIKIPYLNGESITVFDAIKILSVVASLTIDGAKHGCFPSIPKEINAFLKNSKMPYFTMWRKKSDSNRKDYFYAKEHKRNNFKLKYADPTNCTMDRLCIYMEDKLDNMKIDYPEMHCKYNISKLFKSNLGTKIEKEDIYCKVKRKLIKLQDEYYKISNKCFVSLEKEDEEERKFEISQQYHIFFDYATQELLQCCNDVDRLIDIILYAYYVDGCFKPEADKSILWNCFGLEMIQRVSDAKGKPIKYNGNRLEHKIDNNKKRAAYIKKAIRKKETVFIPCLKDKTCTISIDTIKSIHVKLINSLNAQRLLLALFLICKMLNSSFIIERNKDHSITPTSLCKIADIDGRNFDKAIEMLEENHVVELAYDNTCSIRFNEVNVDGSKIKINNINECRHLCRKYLKYESHKNNIRQKKNSVNKR